MMRSIVTVTALLSILVAASAQAAAPADDALKACGAAGGLVVHVGCGDGRTTAGLRAGDAFLVHGLDADPASVAKARQHIQSLGSYGPVSVDVWDGQRLPYADGTVTVIVDEASDGGVSRAEAQRVLAPRGVHLLRKGGAWQKAFTQPVPQATDEWTHYRHDPTNNKVAADDVVGPPRRIQWAAGPQMLRHHDHLTSLNAMVSAKGRLFYILDEAPPASIMLPPKWRLIARDAYNGVTLWKKPIGDWVPHLWPLKSMPATLPRRLVSVGDDVFATLSIRAPVSHLRAADGAEVKTFAGSDGCEEILVQRDTLLALCLTGKGPLDTMNEPSPEYIDARATKFPLLAKLASGAMSPLWLRAKRRLIAYDVAAGKERWHADGQFAPLTLATDGKKVYFHDGEAVVALDAATGRRLWKSPEVPVWKDYFSWFGASLVVHDDIVLFAGGENMTWARGGTKTGGKDTMTALSAADGHKLWTAPHPPSGYRSPEDLVVAQGLVWAPDCTHRSSAVLNGLDPHTGEVVRTFQADYGHGFHHRCHPGKATRNYLMLAKVGINMVRFDGKGVNNDQWVRGACGYGFMPANGLIYAPPDPCNCYAESKLNGFVALAPEGTRHREHAANALVKGPAFDTAEGATVVAAAADEWPMYRGDAARRGSTDAAPPAALKPAWTADIGGRASAPVIAGGRVYLAAIDRHQVLALDAASGKTVWARTVGGRVDSPPTILRVRTAGGTEDLCLFGCADGSVYCLRGSDGERVWRSRIAPADERIVSDDRLESVWPVHGSVLYHNGLIYAVAGRTAFVDGGIRACGLDPLTGAVKVSETRGLEGQHLRGMDTEPAKPDILSAWGDQICMRSLTLDPQCRPVKSQEKHIFAANGFLDPLWFHRAFWIYGTDWSGGCGGFGKTGNANPAGRIIVADDNRLYVFGRQRYGWGSAFEYTLHATDIGGPPPKAAKGKRRSKGGKRTAWSVDSPVLVRAMVKAGDRLLVAGPKRLYDEQKAIQSLEEPEVQALVAKQAEAWDNGALLTTFSAKDGRAGTTVTLASLPVWDGMAVAGRAVYVSCRDGRLRCLK